MKFKSGDKVYCSYSKMYGVCFNILGNHIYSVKVVFKNGSEDGYTKDGRPWQDMDPSLRLLTPLELFLEGEENVEVD